MTWVLAALLCNKLLVAQKVVKRLQLKFQLHPCCIKEENRISQLFIFTYSTGMLNLVKVSLCKQPSLFAYSIFPPAWERSKIPPAKFLLKAWLYRDSCSVTKAKNSQ